MASKVKSMDTVFVSNDCVSTQRFFTEQGFKVAKTRDQAFDICVFSGGCADVHPFLYGQKRMSKTHVDLNRDLEEVSLWKSLPLDMPKIGICRGAQLGNVMCGGTLWQDVDNHKHGIHMCKQVDLDTGKETFHSIMTLHHQMCRPAEDASILVTAKSATKFEDDEEVRTVENNQWVDVEAFYYKHQNFLGVQWHPEYNHKASTDLFLELFYTHMFN